MQLAFSSGTDTWDAVFGAVDTDARTKGQRRLARFLAGVAGETIHTVTEQRGVGGPPVGTALAVTPHSPGLRERIWYGSGSLASARGAARQRLRLITGTILHDVPEGRTFSEHQADLIAAYRDEWLTAHGTAAPPVAVAASILPATTSELDDPGLIAADELVLFLQPAFGLADNVTLLTALATHVAPALGWTPS